MFRPAKSFLCSLPIVLITLAASAADNPFLGQWELTIPGGAAGWLGVQETDGRLGASMLWGWGSVEPVAAAKIEDGKLVLTRNYTVQRKNAEGKREKVNLSETITGSVDEDKVNLTSVKPRENGQGEDVAEFSGRRQPPMPPAPDLTKVKFGRPMRLFDGKDLKGWRLTDPNALNGWSVQDGLLVNNAVQEKGQPHKNYGNLRTDREFNDFNLKVEVRVDKGENSGVYLRGIYECQVEDSYGEAPDSHHMGAIYSRITPTVAAEKPPGQWQTMDITFVDRHATVILNGTKIIDNQPVMGCTGGALWSDVSRPGPIYLQGDHTGITYRSLVLRQALE
ncbi:MAG TPA: DUF1080 domain-containing protein [Verrucomicrobiae bacterium]|nr:DUF1080 domain-containing protein [Verrucomicrobiae bacterium]